jgi:hypothetical protein
MKLENQVCSLELARELKELGVKQESLFWWAFDKKQNGNWGEPNDAKYSYLWDVTYSAGLMEINAEVVVSAFTVAELGEMLKNLKYISGLPSWDGSNWVTIGHDFKASTEADARAKMLIYLLENNLLTNEK